MVDKDCNDYSKGCKYFHHEPYYTPNNYDLFFDYNSVPVNIPVEKPHDLRNRLQKLMPLSQIIHLNMDNETFEEDNNIHLHTNLRMSYTTNEEPLETRIKLTGVWNDLDTSKTSTVNYTAVYSQDNEPPVNRLGIRLINLHNPQIQFAQITNEDGECVFTDIPQGTYVEQVVLDGVKIQPNTINITESTVTRSLIVPVSDSQAENGLELTYYRDGIFLASSLVYNDNGVVTATDDSEYENGVLTVIGSDDRVIDDNTIILLFKSENFEEINDYSEFTVEIIAGDNVVETVKLNFRNNYTNTSRKLPIYDGTDRITYLINNPQPDCDVASEFFDVVRLESNEVSLL